MAEITFPSLADIIQRMQIDVQNEFPESNPYLPESYILALITGNAARYYENNIQLNTLLNLLYLNTTEDEFLNSCF